MDEDFNCPHCGFEYPSEWLKEHSLPDTCDGCGEGLEKEVNNGAEGRE